MGTFDNWVSQRDSEFISIVKYLDDLASKNDSTIKSTISYLFEHNYLSKTELYIHCGLCVTVVDNSGLFDIETPREVLTAIFKELTNPFGSEYKSIPKDTRNRFSDYYVRKSELPAIEPVATNQPQAGEIEQQTAILQRDPLLTNLDIFSIVEASCLISGDNPIQVNICSNDTNFWQTYDEYLKAESFISAGIKSGKLDSDITRQSLQKYLLEKSYVIEGFNDNLPPVTADKIGHATITQTMPTDSQLSQQLQATIDQQAKEIAELKAQLASVEAGKDNQSKDNERPNVISVKVNDETAQILNTLADEQGITVGECLRNAVLEMLELYELYEKLADPNSDKYSEQGQKLIEYIKSNVPDPEKLYSLLKKANVLPIEQASDPNQSHTPADGEQLALVFDSTNANYAPDLVHALNLWLDLYHRNPKDSDSHTNKANIWLKNNTAYEYVKRGDTAMSRIREIATPLKDFGQQRAKEPKK